MKKRALMLLTGMAVLASMLALRYTFSQEDIVSLEDSAFEDRKRPGAVFVHEDHNEKAKIEECNVCHHVFEDGKKVEDESSEDMSCSECHKVKSDGNTKALMRAYHDLCKSCHQENKSGPIMCGECHVRK